MNKELKEKIARNAACIWCRCFKCDGIIRDTHDECDQEKLLTCHQWYHGYRTAMIALENYEQHIMNDSVDGLVDSRLASEEDDVVYYAAHYPINKQPFRCGDKVKMIILKDQ